MTHTCARTRAGRLRRDTYQGSSDALPAPSSEEISHLAYEYWEARGRCHGSPHEDWYRAERELLRRRHASEPYRAL